MNEATFFLFKSEKKTDEGHLKQMREGLRNNYLFFLGLKQLGFHVDTLYISFNAV